MTLTELGKIMRENASDDQIRDGYQIDPTDEAEVGRQALLYGDINRDGTLN